jgi:hypothetical protein
MKRIHILTEGFVTPNGRAFLMPLLVHHRALLDAGIEVRLFAGPAPSLTDCDALLLDGKFFVPRWATETQAVLEEIAGYRAQIDNLVYVDLADSAAWDHARALPYVKLYCKSQLLRDRSAYLKPLYGYRGFSDYYHRHFGVEDGQPVRSEPVNDPAQLEKLTVCWNSGLADYSWLGPYRMHLYQHVPWLALLRYPNVFYPSESARSHPVSCRMGTNYIRDSVSFQRRRLAEVLNSRMATGKLSRRKYIDELRRSRVVVSPFGYGEITLRDFEIFMNGALLLKPDMSGVETWPDFYRDGDTMVAHRWDLGDVIEKIEAALSDAPRAAEIAERGQVNYRRHLCGQDATRLFVEHLLGILTKLDMPAIASQAQVPAGEPVAATRA